MEDFCEQELFGHVPTYSPPVQALQTPRLFLEREKRGITKECWEGWQTTEDHCCHGFYFGFQESSHRHAQRDQPVITQHFQRKLLFYVRLWEQCSFTDLRWGGNTCFLKVAQAPCPCLFILNHHQKNSKIEWGAEDFKKPPPLLARAHSKAGCQTVHPKLFIIVVNLTVLKCWL